MKEIFVRLELNGASYKLSRNMLLRYPKSRLGQICSTDKSKNITLFFERPHDIFDHILSYYQTGKLHMPFTICPSAYKEELDFWKIPPTVMEKCCYYRYISFFKEQEHLRFFSMGDTNVNKDGDHLPNTTCGKGRKLLWNILDYKTDTCLSKAYFIISTLFILLAVFSVAISTLPSVKKINNNNTISNDVERNTPVPITAKASTSTKIKHASSMSISSYLTTDKTDLENSSAEFNTVYIDEISNPFQEAPEKKIPTIKTAMENNFSALNYIEHVTNVFFLVELILRLLSCPSVGRYFCSIFNVIDIVVILSSFGRYALHFVLSDEKNIHLENLLYLQMFRCLRLLRVTQNVTAFKVLRHTLKIRKKDILVMLIYIAVAAILFSNFVYFVEKNVDFPSIPDTWWWCVITMTTVGYGDMIPKTVLGKVIGSLCAITGVFLFALIIPIFIQTFMTFYEVAALQGDKINEFANCKDAQNPETPSESVDPTML